MYSIAQSPDLGKVHVGKGKISEYNNNNENQIVNINDVETCVNYYLKSTYSLCCHKKGVKFEYLSALGYVTSVKIIYVSYNNKYIRIKKQLHCLNRTFTDDFHIVKKKTKNYLKEIN